MSHAGISETDWTSSSYSQANGGECVEWAPAYAVAHDVVPVRDSKRPTGPVLKVSPVAWTGLVTMAAGSQV
ncbi:DUF397 domain-containing protein [Streptomyces sp. TRM76323]|uniref:DUF397 domain-containing protein n=1 Tax=Streptomyces tamarix TaxID=3078565 RepID=A0ABU3QT99_9ACTN|nr:DUF397 domain-containing protein [Streptomyces tamarix]MDT9686003.1 DUF397 domain-containing protein [Streptomyces tamarix]